MATGDTQDCVARIDANLPIDWFGDDETPNLDALLAAYAESGAFLYSLAQYVKNQTRIKTATDTNLEAIAQDYFGFNNFNREPDETDDSYRMRILANLVPQGATRYAMINVLTALTGNVPRIFQPQRPLDTGGYNGGYIGYGVAGGWSNPNLAYQCFISVYSQVVSNVAYVAGWNVSVGALNTPSRAAWSNSSQRTTALLQQQIFAAINKTKCCGTICWVQVQSPS